MPGWGSSLDIYIISARYAFALSDKRPDLSLRPLEELYCNIATSTISPSFRPSATCIGSPSGCRYRPSWRYRWTGSILVACRSKRPSLSPPLSYINICSQVCSSFGRGCIRFYGYCHRTCCLVTAFQRERGPCPIMAAPIPVYPCVSGSFCRPISRSFHMSVWWSRLYPDYPTDIRSGLRVWRWYRSVLWWFSWAVWLMVGLNPSPSNCRYCLRCCRHHCRCHCCLRPVMAPLAILSPIKPQMTIPESCQKE